MNRVSRHLPWFLVVAVALAGCSPSEEHRAQFFVFGTVVEVSVWSDDGGAVDRAFARLQQEFQAMHRDWHAWKPGRLTRINEAFAAGQAAPADEHIIALTERAREIEKRSGGNFNAAIGRLVRLWGFHSSEFPVEGPPPDHAAIEAILRQRPSADDIRIEGRRMRSVNSAVQLDFGGIAKGYAIDLACALLRDMGLANAIVNAGGDLRVIGRRGDRPWRIAIRNPSGGIIGALEARADEAIFTSGNYQRFRRDGDRRYPHILDPHTGWPVEELVSVTVVASEGTLADAAATALIVAGSEGWPEVAGALRLEQVLVVDETGLVHATPAMAERVELAKGVRSVVVGTLSTP